MLMPTSVPILEALAFRAWPANEVEPCGGWHLRYTSGVSRRANSAFCNGWDDSLAAPQAIALVEAFYQRRGARPLFQLGPLSQPAGLDEILARRGYSVDAPVRILAAPVREVLARFEGFRLRTSPSSARVFDTLTDPWFDLSGRKGRFAGQEEAYLGILRRIGQRAGFALLACGEENAAVGLGVCEPPWAGIFSMSTLAPWRRRGAASRILVALAEWAEARGATNLYLQVETANHAARALYETAGFVDVYGYHYRLLPDGA